MITKLFNKKDPLKLMIESKIDPWEIHKSKQRLRGNLKVKERLFHLEGKWNNPVYGTKEVVETFKRG